MIGARARIAELPQIAIPTVTRDDSGGTTPVAPRQHCAQDERCAHRHDDRERAGAAGLHQLSDRQARPQQRDPDAQGDRGRERGAGKQPLADRAETADDEADRKGDRRLEPELERGAHEPGGHGDCHAGRETEQDHGELRGTDGPGSGGQSRTRGGLSRSNMWTVSTNRTCLA